MTIRFHHVANGSSTTDLIARAGLPGTRSIWADPLHDGPVPSGLSDRELLAVRARHLAGASGQAPAEVTAELERWRSAIDGGEWDELVLWYEHDLFDQLNLIQLLDHLQRRGAASRRVTLISIGEFPGRPGWKGFGELAPGELAALFATRIPLSAAQYELAGRAWEAFRAPDPQPIERLLATDASALPFLAAALRRHLEELPSVVDGLSRCERRVLELASGSAAVDLRSVFRHVADGETAFYLADLSFLALIEALRRASPPLVDLAVEAGAAAETPGLPRGALSITDVGRSVLAGRLDRVAGCGIVRSLGGVHLEGRGPVWRWDAERGRVVRR